MMTDDLRPYLEAARGDRPVDLLIAGVRIVDVFSGAVISGDIAVFRETIVGIGEYTHKKRLDLHGYYAAPGFIDAHVHIESAMLDVPAFVRAVLPRGTTSVVADPHEIANVMGADGLRHMLQSAVQQPMDLYFSLPSCVPATDMETAGARLSAEDLHPFIRMDRIVALAEMMNYPGAVQGEKGVLQKIAAARAAGKPVDGHAPGVGGKPLSAYILAGMSSDHECTSAAEALEKLRAGMFIMVREGTGARNLAALVPLVDAHTAARMMWCTDDRHPQDLMDDGHIDALVRQAIAAGVDPVTAIRMATLSPAGYFGLRRKGAIGPGRSADIVFFRDLSKPVIEKVMARGKLVAENGRMRPAVATPAAVCPPSSIHVRRAAVDLTVAAVSGRMRVIEAVEGQVRTGQCVCRPALRDGKAVADPGRDLLKLAVIERHCASGRTGIGFVKGFKLKKGALAASVAHDSHNIIILGTTDEDMYAALDELIRVGGGLAVARDGKPAAVLPLPVAGLMSTDPLPAVRRRLDRLTAAARGMGCMLHDPFMTLSFLALPVIPRLKLSDRGLIDVQRFAFVPLFVDEKVQDVV